MIMHSFLMTLCVSVALLCLLTPPTSGAAVSGRLPRAEPEPAADVTRLLNMRVQAWRDLLQGLLEMQQTYERGIGGSAFASLSKCAAVGETCNLPMECCHPLVCHHHTPLDLGRPNRGMTIGFCGLQHHER